ncbi:SRPBCC domain-containing protein [Litoribacter alkaliphilus]|uniref:SRPBCC domain-containing protein n=1 Tax=Litoribacter ruber TaxID=702568 RepID=A0AAP2G692_9BACT|nr:SRPBCC family protein [Litoribacter alkaliphilus]MBS9525816.1 SRPBCC domain-containing protein [Litoribacter alkaliphilus]
MEKLALVKLTVSIKAPLSQVWGSWTSAEHIVNWNFASEDWHCPKAKLELRSGGEFSYHMAAKDGSQAFDFKGEFEEVVPMQMIKFHLDDGRKVQVHFKQMKDHVEIVEEFEAESSHSIEMQRQGWQAILENFKVYTESLSKLHRLHFDVQIEAPAQAVYEIMLAPDTYREWTAAFHPGSYYKGKWEVGETLYFIGPDAEGRESGMVAKVTKAKPGEIVGVEMLGMLDKGVEVTEGPEIETWKGAVEEYRFEERDSATTVRVTVDTIGEYKAYFEETWPKALQILKTICETTK